MTVIEIWEAFTFYGIDVVCLAASTCLIVHILKRTLLKKTDGKIITYLPFAVGTALYAAYAAAVNLDIRFVFTEYVYVLEHGLSVGAASTLLYALYKRLVRRDELLTAAESAVSELIAGYVPDGEADGVAKLICGTLESGADSDATKSIKEIISENAGSEVSGQEIELLANLIAKTVARTPG